MFIEDKGIAIKGSRFDSENLPKSNLESIIMPSHIYTYIYI